MLTITQQTIEAFEMDSTDSFRSRAATFVRHNFSEVIAHWSDSHLSNFVSSQHNIANLNGVAGQAAVMKWLMLALIAGNDFHLIREVQLALASDDPEIVIESLYDRVGILVDRRSK